MSSARPGDRKLDSAIEREIFGGEVYESAADWEAAGQPHAPHWPAAPIYPVVWQASPDEGAALPVPPFSSVVAAAGVLGRFSHERGWNLRIHCAGDDCWAMLELQGTDTLVGDGRGDSQHAAVARAVLSAVRRERGDTRPIP